jgi:hypothetical protein
MPDPEGGVQKSTISQRGYRAVITLLHPSKRTNPTARANSKLDKTCGQRQRHCSMMREMALAPTVARGGQGNGNRGG